MPPTSVGKNRWVKGETRNVLGGVSRGSYAQAPSRASESVFSDDLSSNGSYSQNVGHFGAHASYQAHSTAAGARAGYRNGRANYVANASSFTTSACSHAGKAAVMVCIVVGAAFLAFGGDRVGDVYSKLAPSAEAFTSRIDDEAVLDNVVNGVHKAAADAASRPGFERSSFSAAEGEGTAADDDDDAFIKRAFADQPPLVVPTPAHRSKKKLARLTRKSTDFLQRAFRDDANDAFIRSAYGDGKFLADAYESELDESKTEHSKPHSKSTRRTRVDAEPVDVDAADADAEAAPAATKKAKAVETVDASATKTETKTRHTETEQRLAREVRARRSSARVSTRASEKKETTKDEPSPVHREASSKSVEKSVEKPSAAKAVEVSGTGKREHHDGREKEGKTKKETKDEKKEEALQEEARRQAEEIMADAAKASAHAESDFKPTTVPREGEVRLSCVADETGAMHCEYPGAFDGETPIHTPKHGDKKKSHRESTSSKKSHRESTHTHSHAREEASEGKKESGSHRESSNHREKAKLGAEIWKPVGIGKQIPVTLHPFEADEMTRMPAGVDM